ncbi:MAG: DUF4386 domain-containing protein [Rhodothermaceae bacterium]|nr:DUF4386 domain-containing protein [Rhodothermaceae bacterium]
MNNLKKTARITGLWYLGLAITGILGFLLVRPAIYVPSDPAATAQNLVEREALARLGVMLELGIVATQVLAAVWFYKLFRSLNSVAAGSLAAFGFVNAIAVLGSAACMSTAVAVAGDASLAPAGDVAATSQLLYEASLKLWGVGKLFFGLWLIPMGYVAATSGRMPKALGWTLLVGGAGYILSTFLENGLVGAPSWLVQGLTAPATIGEFWMLGYLLAVGIRPPTNMSTEQ